MLTKKRLDAYLADVREKMEGVNQVEIDKLDAAMSIDFNEHFAMQELQAQMFATGIIDSDVAQFIHTSLGATFSPHNGGWRDRVDASTKVTITKVMAELLEVRARLLKSVAI